jgi:Zn-dependent peptidase ImmA (M78 family)
MEQSLGYLLVRYPFGRSAMDGFSAIYQDKHLVVTNSSQILSRERFTAAHEIGHHIYDFTKTTSRIKADQETGHFNEQDPIEYQADCFAVALLIPKEGIEMVLHDMKLGDSSLTHVDVVRLQLEFGVSYRAMVRRLNDLGRIDDQQKAYLYNYYGKSKEALNKLFRRANAPSTALLEPYNKVWVPTRYLRCMEANYEANLISYPVLQKILDVIGVRAEDWGFEPQLEPEMKPEEDIDALIKELSDEV